MRGAAFDYYPTCPRRTFDLLRVAPNLTECLFRNSDIESDMGTTEILVLPKLRRLMFGEGGTCPTNSQDLLGYLSLPALETLGSDESSDDLFSFLSRSTTPPGAGLWGCLGLRSVGPISWYITPSETVRDMVPPMSFDPTILYGVNRVPASTLCSSTSMTMNSSHSIPTIPLHGA
ncbi:hypothetical protein B0H14DRAFT_3456152 [Mycena olivaceomarginata]|nr:hypothetical protein B0H14DRAFT_3456152 [Mycena olivaceomarginata]